MSKILEAIEEVRSITPALLEAQRAASLRIPQVGSDPAYDGLWTVKDEHSGKLVELIDKAVDEIEELEGIDPNVGTLLMNFSTIGSVPLRVGAEVVFEMNPDLIEYNVVTADNPGELVYREGFFGGFAVLDIAAEDIDLQAVKPELEALEICMPLLERGMDPEDRFIPLSRINLASIQHGVWVPLPKHTNPTIADVWKD